MLEGTIRSIDHSERKAIIAVEDGSEVTVHFPADASIEVMELETVGTTGGELEDIEVGYHVEFEVKEQLADGSCTCATLASIS